MEVLALNWKLIFDNIVKIYIIYIKNKISLCKNISRDGSTISICRYDVNRFNIKIGIYIRIVKKKK